MTWSTHNGGTLTKTEDSPSNVFATWNPLNEISGQYLIQMEIILLQIQL